MKWLELIINELKICKKSLKIGNYYFILRIGNYYFILNRIYILSLKEF